MTRPQLWIALLLAALATLWLALAGGPGAADGGTGRGPAAAPGAPPAAPTAGVGGELERAADPGPRRTAPPDDGARPGVRLAGEGRLEGRVLTLEGEPVAEAAVALWPLPPSFAVGVRRALALAAIDADFRARVEPIATAVSGGDGRFAFAGVREGRYFLEARAALHVPHAASVARVLPSGEGGPVEVLVRPGGAVAGRVLDADGRAVGGGRVALYQGAATVFDAARRSDAIYFEAPTDGGGSFRFDGVPPGEGYELTAFGGALVLSHAGDLTVVAGQTTRADVVLRRGGRVVGRVLGAPAGPAAADGGADAVPLAGAWVGAIPRGLRDLAFVRAVVDRTLTRADAAGRYVLDGVPPGEVDVVAWAPGFLPRHLAGVRVAPDGLAPADDLVLAGGPVLTGTVVDDGGAPVEGARVRWELAEWSELEFDFSAAPLLYQALDDGFFPRTDADGRFAAGPFPGSPDFELFVLADGFELEVFRWRPERDGDDVRIVLSRGGRAAGIVVDAADGSAVPSFVLTTAARIDERSDAPSVLNPFSGGVEVEHPQGRFELGPLAAGEVQLEVRAPGYRPTTERLTVRAGETTRGVIVELERGARVEGRVVDPDGAPVAGARVLALDPRGGVRGRPRFEADALPGAYLIDRFLESAPLDIGVGAGLFGDAGELTDRDGRFALEGLEPGTARLVAAHRDFAPTTTDPLTLTAGDATPPVELVLSRGAALAGRVRDLGGRPVEGALVVAVSPPDGDPGPRGGLYQARTDALGAYRIAPMAAGSYFVLTTRPDAALSPVALFGAASYELVAVPRAGEVTLDLVDRSRGGTRVFGRVVGADGPVAGGALFAADFDSDNLLGFDFKLAEVGPGGAYEFPGLAPGSYQWTYQNGDGEVLFEVDVPDRPEFRHDVELPSGSVRGRVVARDDGRGVPYAEVVLERVGSVAVGDGLLAAVLGRRTSERRAFTDSDGGFLFPALEAGDYRLAVVGPRFGPRRREFAGAEPRPVTVEVGQRLEGLEIELAPSLGLSGRVVDGRGRPVEGARVLCLPRGRPDLELGRRRTGPDGRFGVDGLGPGLHDLVASHPDHAEGRLEGLELVAGEPGPEGLELVLPAGVELSARVTVDGLPAAGALARVTRLGADGAERARAAESALEGVLDGRGVCDGDGRVALGRLVPGRYRLEVTRGSRSAVVEPLEVREGPPLTVEVELR